MTAQILTFSQQMAAYTAEFGPANHHERFLVESMAHARWKIENLRLLETKLVMELFIEERTRLQAQDLAMLQKHIAAGERSYYKAFRELQAGRKAEAKAESEAFRAQVLAIANTPMPSIEEVDRMLAETKPRPAESATKTASAAPSPASGFVSRKSA